MKKQLISLFGLFLILGLMSIPFVSADNFLTAYYNGGTGACKVTASYLSAGSVQSATGETFAPSVNGYLDAISVDMNHYDHTGVEPLIHGTIYLGIEEIASISTAPTGTPYIISDTTYDIQNLVQSPSFSYYQFDFNNTYYLNSSRFYAFYIYSPDLTGYVDSEHVWQIHESHGSDGYTAGYNVLGWDSALATLASEDINFWVFVTDDIPATPTPTPTPSPTPEAMPNWISDIIDAIIPIFTPLLVIFICGALGWRFAGAWGFFAGINLAIVLLYVIAPAYMPLWAIVAVIVVDIGLLFGKVGFDRR